MNELIKVDAFTQALAEAKTIPEVKNLADQADLFRQWLKKQRVGRQAQNTGAEMCLRAQRKLGEMLSTNPEIHPGNPQWLHHATIGEMGIEKTQSHRWQRLAEIPEDEFQEFLNSFFETEDEITTKALLRFHLEKAVSSFPPSEPLPPGIFNVFYADPPWKYERMQHSTEEHLTTLDIHYNLMDIEEICAIPVKAMAADDAVLFLWTTSPFLEKSFAVVKAWGFEYKTSMIWDKVRHNVGYYVSVRHEFLLICTKGRMLPENPVLFDSVQTIERSNIHSQKPKEFYEIIETLYPRGTYIELFQRGTGRPGWTPWGNEIG